MIFSRLKHLKLIIKCVGIRTWVVKSQKLIPPSDRPQTFSEACLGPQKTFLIYSDFHLRMPTYAAYGTLAIHCTDKMY